MVIIRHFSEAYFDSRTKEINRLYLKLEKMKGHRSLKGSESNAFEKEKALRKRIDELIKPD